MGAAIRIALLVTLLGGCAAASRGGRVDELVLCGRDEVFILDVSVSGAPRRVWSWRAAQRPELPEPLRKQFGATDECKPVEEGAKILITSSGGGIALVERASGKALFWASVPNAHSAEVLPGGRLVAASSYHAQGNRLILYDLAVPEKPLWWGECYGAHGAVWDEERKTLWALGDKELRSYRLKDWETAAPSLALSESFPLPGPGGHDLRAKPSSGVLLVTTNDAAWHFGRDRKTFVECPALPGAKSVKSLDVHPLTGRAAYIQAEVRHWAERVRFLDPPGELPLAGERLYKARWNVPPERSAH